MRDLADPGLQDSVTNLMDSRTLNTALHALQTRGEIRMTTLLVPDAVGISVRRPIVYLSTIALDSPDMISWLEEMRTRAKFVHEEPINVNSKRSSSALDPPNLSKAKKKVVKRRPMERPTDEALHEAFRNQWRCVAQLYGFMIGRVARAQSLHMALLEAFRDQDSQKSSNLFQSENCRLVACGFLFQDLPVEVFVKLVPIMSPSEEFEAFRATPGAMQKTVSQVPYNIRRVLNIGNQFSRQKVYQTVEILCHLRVLIPLIRSTSTTEFKRLASNGQVIYYEPCQVSLSVGLFWLANEGTIYKFSQSLPDPPPLLAKWPLKDTVDGAWFWTELKRASIPDPDAPPVQQTLELPDDHQQLPRVFPGSHRLSQLMSDQTKWYNEIQLTWSQKEHALRFDHQHKDPPLDLDYDVEELARLARIIYTSPEALKAAILVMRKAAEAREAAKRLRAKKVKAGVDTKAADSERLRLAREEASKVLADKAKNALKQKQEDWNSVIKRFKAQTGVEEIDEDVIKDLHILFTSPTRGINATQLQAELTGWLKRKEESKQYELDEQTTEISVENLPPRKPGQLPLLPSVKAKMLKIKKPKPARPVPRKSTRKLPDRPLRYSTVAARAIRPQPQVELGSRPKPGKSSYSLKVSA